MKILILVLIVSLGFVVGCGRQAEESAATKKSEPEKRSVAITTVNVVAEDVPIILETVGEIQSKSAPTVDAEIPGRVIQLLVDVGDVVKKGQVIARLDRTSVDLERDATQAELRRLTAVVNNQESTVRRYQELSQSSFVSKNSLDEVESQLAALREQLAVAHAKLSQAEDHANKASIISPIDGLVDARLVAVGDYVKDGAPIFKVADTGKLRVVMVFPEPALSKLRIGTPLRVKTAVDYDRVIRLAITEIRPYVETANKGIVAYADVNDPRVSRAGASAYVQAILETHKNALIVPQLSVVQRPAGEVVYVIGKDNKAVERIVHTGANFDGKIEILSGLAKGERVAVDGSGFLTDGASVELKN